MPLLVAPAYTGITPVSAHVRRAIQFNQLPEIYVAIGKTSPWPDDATPPVPDPVQLAQTGTVDTVGTNVTGTGTAFTAFDVGRLIFINGEVRQIATWTDASTVTIDSALSVDAVGASFSMSPVVEEIVGFVKVQQNKLVVPDNAGPINVYGATWREVDPADAYKEQARRVWLQGEFAYDAVSTSISYRQVGIYSGLVRDPADLLANPGKTVLLPADVVDPGVLEYIYHDRPIPRALNRRDVLNVIITF